MVLSLLIFLNVIIFVRIGFVCLVFISILYAIMETRINKMENISEGILRERGKKTNTSQVGRHTGRRRLKTKDTLFRSSYTAGSLRRRHGQKT